MARRDGSAFDNWLVPALGLGALLGVVLLSRSSSASSPNAPAPGPGPAPNPNPNPNPPLPGPPLSPQEVLARAAVLIQQAQANPASVDPAQLDAVATQLDAVGRADVASVVRAWATSVRLSRNLPVPPGATPLPPVGSPPPVPGDLFPLPPPPVSAAESMRLQQEFRRLRQIAQTTPNQPEIVVQLEALIPQLQQANLGPLASELRAISNRLWLERRRNAPPASPDPTICTPGVTQQLPPAILARIDQLLSGGPNTPPSELDILADRIELCGFAAQVRALRQRAAAIRGISPGGLLGGSIGGPPAGGVMTAGGLR